MHLLVAVIHREEVLDDVLSALVETEAPDAVVIESRSGLELLERDLPIFAGLRSLVPGGIDFSRLVLCLIEDDGLAEEALATLRALGDAAHEPSEPRNTAVLIPVRDVEFF
ncbi:MAG: hypothetical protein P8Y93_05985 [Acidobacteriota bacterium]